VRTGGLPRNAILFRGRAAASVVAGACDLVYADAFVVLQAGDFVLHMQLAAFQFCDRGVVD
jgi:hypothetical protein